MGGDQAIEKSNCDALGSHVGRYFASRNDQRARGLVSEASGAFGLCHTAKDHDGTFGDSQSRLQRGHVTGDAEDRGRTARIGPLSVESSSGLRLLPFVLSVIAGCSDVISFVGLGGLFTAHITGNLVILAAHVTSGEPAQLALILSVPVFMTALTLTRLLVGGLESIGLASLRPLVLLQFLLLASSFVSCVASGTRSDPDAAIMIFAGMLGVSAMAVQNAMVQVSLMGAPSTAVMTTNITRFTMDIGEVLLGRDPDEVAKSRRRAKHTWPAIIGFTIGCVLGAVCEAAVGLWSLALPTGLALVAVAMSFARSPDGGERR
jgi:uncharacterized membrane protein YoaK (UPF0700 family)